jgi:hypothetical protein
LKLPFAPWQIWTFGAAAALLLFGVILYLWRRRPHDPDELERARRAFLNNIGRIAEGQIVEIIEQPADSAARSGFFRRKVSAAASTVRTLVSYTYAISGVTYQAAQDVTGFESRINLARIMNGQPASIKYDQANPTNSILLADDWSGLN